MNETVVEVENQYRTRLGAALPGARHNAARIADAFRMVRLAMEDGAWESALGRSFYQACVEAEGDAGRAAGDCVDALESRVAAEPAEVSFGDRRASSEWWW